MTLPGEDSRLIWVDLETTGLNPLVDRILEIAVVVTDADLNEIGASSLQLTIFQEEYVLERMNDWAREAHTANGLIKAVQGSTLRTGDIESTIITWLKAMDFRPRTGVLAGSSVHFDRGFIQMWMPDLHEFLHYRLFDSSTLRGAISRWLPDGDPTRVHAEMKRDVNTNDHRSLADVRSSIEEARRYRVAFRTERVIH